MKYPPNPMKWIDMQQDNEFAGLRNIWHRKEKYFKKGEALISELRVVTSGYQLPLKTTGKCRITESL